LRKLVPALVLAFVATLGAFMPAATVPVAAAATPQPKVAIIVGATHSVTPTYRSRADAAYAEAIKYTSNVVKVYSPNATWDKVKAAIQGASIVIYMGHGNGFPSPYRTTPWPYSQNGFGLNAALGQGDNNVKYYGEHYIGSEIKLAPNAVVLLHHLCYASGNSEPGHAEPTTSVAKQRVDNYAAGFLKAGARAVIADGHGGPAYYIKSLFTTRETVEQMWRKAPNFHNHVFTFASVRSPGYTAAMDPENASSGFYRSLTGRLGLLTQDVTGGTYAPTDADPSSFVVPGNASVTAAGAPVFGSADLAGDPVATLPADARVRVLAASDTAAEPAFQVEAHDGSAAGFVAATNLVPRDSAPPQLWELSTSSSVFSPNGDGRLDTLSINATVSESVLWRVRFWRDGAQVWSGSGNGSTVAATWSGKKDGASVADGTYRWTLDTTDAWGNVSQTKQGDIRVDTTAPSIGGLTLAAGNPAVTFSPNGDGRGDTVAVGWQTDENGAVDVAIRNTSGTVVRTLSTAATGGTPGATTWDGKSASGATVPDGLYTIRLVPRDAAGNLGAAQERTVAVFTALSAVVGSPPRFYPQDLDRFAPTTTLSFTLARTVTVSWRITTLDGTTVLTRFTDKALAPGVQKLVWDGKDAGGAMVPPGMYVSEVRATDGTFAITQKGFVDLNAFTVTSSDTTPARSQAITIKANSAEPISGKVLLHVTQPGIAVWSVPMTGSGLSYAATITLKASSAGTVSFRVSALDADGRWQRTYLNLPLE
jgi:flagellar hook assembly protein FlgD